MVIKKKGSDVTCHIELLKSGGYNNKQSIVAVVVDCCGPPLRGPPVAWFEATTITSSTCSSTVARVTPFRVLWSVRFLE